MFIQCPICGRKFTFLPGGPDSCYYCKAEISRGYLWHDSVLTSVFNEIDLLKEFMYTVITAEQCNELLSIISKERNIIDRTMKYGEEIKKLNKIRDERLTSGKCTSCNRLEEDLHTCYICGKKICDECSIYEYDIGKYGSYRCKDNNCRRKQ